MRGHVALIVGGILMLLLGIARGVGGIVLLMQGPAADPRIRATASTAAVLAAILIVLGVLLVATAVGVLRRGRGPWLWGIWLTIGFVIDGALNGYLLYGRPGDRGTVMNVVAAVLIILCLWLGRGSLKVGSHASMNAG